VQKSRDISSAAEKIAAGGVLDFRGEFCPWIGVSAVTGYKMVAAGQV